jgi:hypothetical protein
MLATQFQLICLTQALAIDSLSTSMATQKPAIESLSIFPSFTQIRWLIFYVFAILDLLHLWPE